MLSYPGQTAPPHYPDLAHRLAVFQHFSEDPGHFFCRYTVSCPILLLPESITISLLQFRQVHLEQNDKKKPLLFNVITIKIMVDEAVSKPTRF
jgi:hypothetical protein